MFGVNHMKKLGTLVCLSTALLGADLAQAQWTGNWLLGASAGWANQTGYLENGFAIADVAFGDTSVSDKNRIHNDGFIGGVFGGYQIRCNGWLMGVELNVAWQDHGDEHTYLSTQGPFAFGATAKYKRDATVGLTGRFGYEFFPWLATYVRGGVETSKDKLDVDSAFFNPATGNVIPALTASADGSHRNWRGILGVGVELPVPVMTGITARVEYDYHFKGKRVEATAFTVEEPTDAFAFASARPETHSVMASVVWNFMP